MKPLFQYIKQIQPPRGICKLSEEDKEKLLNLDKLYNDFCIAFHRDCDCQTILNMDEEFNTFISCRRAGQKYFPILQRPKCKFTIKHIRQGQDLLAQFNNFDCFLSKYYIELIQSMVQKIKFFMDPRKHYMWYTTYQAQTPTFEEYNAALKCIQKYPYRNVPETARNIDAKTAQKLIQDHIDKLGYEWTVKLSDKLIPRMAVHTDKTMDVKTSAKFSQTDITGLKRHEVEGHVGRRYYGLKTGLYLFLYGLLWKNDLDEGLAVYNSLHKVKTVKPNVHFNTAIKTIIAYQLNKMDFCELFDFCKELAPDFPDKKLFVAMARFKREVEDCSIMGGNGDDQSYFCGYLMVKNMTNQEREDILKYNVGPGQISDIPYIKEFLDLNKFEPLI